MRLTDEQIEEIEKTFAQKTYMERNEIIVGLIHERRIYKQQAEERGKALEEISDEIEQWRDEKFVRYIIPAIVKQALGKE